MTTTASGERSTERRHKDNGSRDLALGEDCWTSMASTTNNYGDDSSDDKLCLQSERAGSGGGDYSYSERAVERRCEDGSRDLALGEDCQTSTAGRPGSGITRRGGLTPAPTRPGDVW